MNDFFEVILMSLGVPFREAEDKGVHDFKDRFLVDSPQHDILKMLIIGNNLQDL